jgi:hypothetical protein
MLWLAATTSMGVPPCPGISCPVRPPITFRRSLIMEDYTFIHWQTSNQLFCCMCVRNLSSSNIISPHSGINQHFFLNFLIFCKKILRSIAIPSSVFQEKILKKSPIINLYRRDSLYKVKSNHIFKGPTVLTSVRKEVNS